ncbi:uncharacterized protein UTRI_01254 [Ustilago trichophora]|uniref:Urease accessory protein UreF n=1 Tax=Ustilago trichophora TaxID=86804 RepID=A0A5C3DZA9_9BASI|nr:uncharacterized protein UTRI_01254 [Ustilago trichophora]
MSQPPIPTSDRDEDTEFETYLLLLLSDSNLPTGGFVASSGLESFYAHGLLHDSRPNLPNFISNSSTAAKRSTAPSQANLSSATLSFAQSTLHSYARSSLPFLSRVHLCVDRYLDSGVRARSLRARARELESEEESKAADAVFEGEQGARLEECLRSISRLDSSYHTLLLNHVARRASKAQGIALLTLYSKAFARPIDLSREPFPLTHHDSPSTSSSITTTADSETEESRISLAAQLVDRLKLDIRRSTTTSSASTAPSGGLQNGHLPICWAVFAACLGITLRKAVFLHLFLQARSLFSSSIRLNTLGPYLAHQVMRFQMRKVVDGVLAEMTREGCLDVPELKAKAKGKAKAKAEAEGQVRVEEAGERAQGYKEEGMELDDVASYTIPDDTQLPREATKTHAVQAITPFRTTATMSTTSTTLLRPAVRSLREGKNVLIPVDDEDPHQGWAWDWPEEQEEDFLGSISKVEGRGSDRGFWTTPSAPATTFPLGEIIQARHDQLHSRLFNS